MTRRRGPVPEIGLWLHGKHEADRLKAQGIELDGVPLSELGRSVVQHQDHDMDQHTADLIEQARERNRVERHKLETGQLVPQVRAPGSPNPHAQDPGPGEKRGLGDEQSDLRTRGDEEACVRNEKIDPIREMIDYEPPDEDWR